MTSIIFFGTPDFVIPILESIHNSNSFQIIAVVTQPDQPVGRKKIITPSPVNLAAQKLGIKVFSPAKLTPEFLIELIDFTYQLTGTHQPDLAVLAAYGKIIKANLLNFPKFGFLNIHPSLLPQWRGATPTLAPILRGESQSGVTFTLMDEQLDHGPILANFQSHVSPIENRDQLTTRLFQEAAVYLPEVITNLTQNNNVQPPNSNLPLLTTKIQSPPYLEGNQGGIQLIIPHQPQNHSFATFTPILEKNDGFISWETFRKARHTDDIDLNEFPEKLRPLISDLYTPYQGAKFIHQACLALSTWPGLWTITPGNRRLKILNSKLLNDEFYPQLVQIDGSTPNHWHKLKSLHD